MSAGQVVSALPCSSSCRWPVLWRQTGHQTAAWPNCVVAGHHRHRRSSKSRECRCICGMRGCAMTRRPSSCATEHPPVCTPGMGGQRRSSCRRVIRLDLPGFGLTGAFPDNDYNKHWCGAQAERSRNTAPVLDFVAGILSAMLREPWAFSGCAPV